MYCPLNKKFFNSILLRNTSQTSNHVNVLSTTSSWSLSPFDHIFIKANTLRNLLKLTIIFVNAKVCSWQPWPSSTSPSKSLPSSTWSLFLQLTTLNAAVKAAGLEATLASPGKLDFEINIADENVFFQYSQSFTEIVFHWEDRKITKHTKRVDCTFTFVFVCRPFHGVCPNQSCLWEDPLGRPSGDPIMW